MDVAEKKTKPKSREYPAVTLADAIAFVEKLKDYPQNKPISYESAASTCGVKTTTNSFKYTLSAAKQYGLIATSAGKAITLLDPAKQFARPTKSQEDLRLLKIECFKTPKLYAELIQEYEGHSLPPLQTLENILINQYSILPAVAKGAANTFITNATDIGIVQSGILDLSTEEITVETASEKGYENTPQSETTAKAAAFGESFSIEGAEFAAPLNIPFGDKRRAMLYMPVDATKEDAEYVRDMISLMFKRVYKVE